MWPFHIHITSATADAFPTHWILYTNFHTTYHVQVHTYRITLWGYSEPDWWSCTSILHEKYLKLFLRKKKGCENCLWEKC